MRPFYINGMLRSLVFGLVGIFTPIYLYKIGVDLWGGVRYGVLMVAGYFILTRIVTLLMAVPVSWVIERIGFRKSIAVSLAILAIYFGSLLFARDWPNLIIVSAIAGGLNIPFYWIARSSAISQDSEKKKVGTQMGIMTTIEQISALLGPLAAGLIIEKWGFQPLYAISLLILLVSIIPLWSMPAHTHRNGSSWRGFYYWMRDRRYFHIGVGVGARAVDDYSITVLWPLAIFVLGIKTGVMGGIFSLTAIISLAVRILMGKVFDKLHRKNDWSDEFIYGVSAFVNSVTWIARIFVKSISSILMLDLTGAVFGTVYSSFYVDYEQLGGKRMGSIAYWVYGEMMYSIMTIGLFVAVAIGAWLGVWREIFMILASFWVIVSIVMARESNL